MAEQMRPRVLAEFAVVNNQVNRELGADFVRYFAEDDLLRRLRALDVPVLLVHGAADPRPLDAVEALADELRRSTLVTLEQVGHFPHWESPASLGTALREFLRLVAISP